MTGQTFLAGKSILAVDDEADILETIEDILEDSKVNRPGTMKVLLKRSKRRPMTW